MCCFLNFRGWRIEAESARDQKGAASEMGQNTGKRGIMKAWHSESISSTRKGSTLSSVTERLRKMKAKN